MKYIIFNWKSYLNGKESFSLAKSLNKLKFSKKYKIIISPSSYSLFTLKNNFKKIELSSQNFDTLGSGGYTSFLPIENLSNFSIKYSLIGHSEVRKYRNENGISFKDKIELFSLHKLKSNNKSIVLKLANTEIIGDISHKDLNADSLIIDSNEYFINNFSNSKSDIKKISEDLEYNQAFLKSVQSKLRNKRFIENAPKNVVNNEKKKEEDIKIKIKMLESKLK